MKYSWLTTLLILTTAGFFGWRTHGRRDAARASHEALVAEMRGLDLDPQAVIADGRRVVEASRGRRTRSDHKVDGKAFSKEFIALALVRKRAGTAGQQDDEAKRLRFREMMNQAMKLDPSQLKALVDDFRATAGFDDEERRGMITSLMMVAADAHPAKALALFEAASDLYRGKGMLPEQLLSSALSHLAQDDPKAALQWCGKNSSNYPALLGPEVISALLAGAAAHDPKMAFEMVSWLDFSVLREGLSGLAGAASTPAERTTTLEAMRDCVAKEDPDRKSFVMTSAMRGFARRMVEDGYDASAGWLQSAKLTDDETTAFAYGLGINQTRGDAGKWIGWISENLPPEQASHKVQGLISYWTHQDYKAAGEWINSTQDGPMKEAAVTSYAQTLAPEEPEAAARWAETLPAGDSRQEIFKSVYEGWKSKAPEAAAIFAIQHGLQP